VLVSRAEPLFERRAAFFRQRRGCAAQIDLLDSRTVREVQEYLCVFEEVDRECA
jgi:hypothetical protein